MQEWAEPEHEEAVMDDEPLLPVYDLAEADQSQDAGDAAEGDWEDSQAEGIPADGASGITDESPEPPIRLQVSLRKIVICFFLPYLAFVYFFVVLFLLCPFAKERQL